MTRFSPVARLSSAALLGASLLLAACGDDGDGGDAAGGSGSGSPLSSLLSGFGTPGAGNPTRPAPDAGPAGGAGGAEAALDAGVVTPERPADPISENCSKACQRVAECMPEGCPNFGRLPRDAQDETVTACENDCGDLSDEQYDVIRRLSCAQVTAELLNVPSVATFCALEPASDEVCDQFCDQLRECGVDLSDDQCSTACIYSAEIGRAHV